MPPRARKPANIRPATATEIDGSSALATQDHMDIEIAADPRSTITVKLGGHVYERKRPKTALLMRLAISAKNSDQDPEQMYEALNEVLLKAFGKATAADIQARLEDSDDDLEYEHVTELMRRLMSFGTGNPSTSS